MNETMSATMQRYSASAVDYAREQFRQYLDYSPESVEQLERVLRQLAESLPVVNPDTERVKNVALTFGAYLGEVMRARWGGDWREGRLDVAPELRLPACTVSPVRKIYERLTQGSGDDVSLYFDWVALTSREVAGRTPAPC